MHHFFKVILKSRKLHLECCNNDWSLLKDFWKFWKMSDYSLNIGIALNVDQFWNIAFILNVVFPIYLTLMKKENPSKFWHFQIFSTTRRIPGIPVGPSVPGENCKTKPKTALANTRMQVSLLIFKELMKPCQINWMFCVEVFRFLDAFCHLRVLE